MSSPSSLLRRAADPERALPGTRIASVVLAFCGPMLALLILLVENGGRVAQPERVLEIGLVASTIVAAASLLLGRRLAAHAVGVVLAVGGYTFFSAGWIPAGPSMIRLAVWAIVSIGGAVLVGWLISGSSTTFNLSTGGLSLIVILLLAYTLSDPVEQEPPSALGFTVAPERTPNVYVLVLDGFVRRDVLHEAFPDLQPDLSGPIADLEALGFVEELDATSNYAQTYLSIPSMLDGTLPVTPENPPSFDARWSAASRALRGENELVRFFRAAGYEYWHSGSGLWDHARCDPLIADRCLGPAASGSEAARAVWASTPVDGWLDAGAEDAQDPVRLVDEILAHADTTSKPVLLFAHIMSPHHPYRFGADCGPAPPNSATLSDGSRTEHRPLFVDQTSCVTQQLASAMDRLVRADPDAIVILQADHGSAFGISLESLDWSPDHIRQRFSTFRMTRMPADCRSADRAAQSAVNTLPILVGCLTGRAPELIDPRWFLTTYVTTEAVVEFDYFG